jgi:uncharacterized SAM-binding protein YcdF (DUF218 family)
MKKLKRVLFFLFGFIAFSFLMIYCSVKRYTGRAYEQAKKDRPYDVVIVPGVPYENESTTNVMTMRIFWAKHLYDSGFTRNIIFSGSAVGSPYVEGIVMKIIADTLGIPEDHTFSETKAEHSVENAYYGWKLARSMGFKKIALATDPFQSRSLESFIEKYCPGMRSVPLVPGVLNLGNKTLPKIDARRAYVNDFIPLSKREGFWQRWRGTMGKRVKEEVGGGSKR